MAKMSRDKGNGYERKIAKILSEWSGVELRRTPLSGGWSSSVAGDLVAVKAYDGDDRRVDDFPFSVECKKRENWNWEQTLHGAGPVFDWWKQTVDQCPTGEGGKIPLLVFSRNRFDDWAMMYGFHLPMGIFRETPTILVCIQSMFIVKLSELLKATRIEMF